jgi:uncharacterized protein YggT (Ycf19 family)
MPDTGAIDFSPIVVIIGARIFQDILYYIAFNVG